MKPTEIIKAVLKTIGVILALFVFVFAVSLLRSQKEVLVYHGYQPAGFDCENGYNPDTKDCCDEDDYSCEVRDYAPKGATAYCNDETYSTTVNKADQCIGHGGIQTDPQFTPFK